MDTTTPTPISPAPASAVMDPVLPAKPRTSLFWKLIKFLAAILAKGKYIFTSAQVTMVIVWSACAIYGPKLTSLGAGDIIWFIVIAVIGILEAIKTLNIKKTNFTVFLSDYSTGMIEYSIILVTFAWMAFQGRLDFTLASNWAMFIFGLMETWFVVSNRFLMAQRTFTDTRAHSSDDLHNDTGAIH